MHFAAALKKRAHLYPDALSMNAKQLGSFCKKIFQLGFSLLIIIRFNSTKFFTALCCCFKKKSAPLPRYALYECKTVGLVLQKKYYG